MSGAAFRVRAGQSTRAPLPPISDAWTFGAWVRPTRNVEGDAAIVVAALGDPVELLVTLGAGRVRVGGRSGAEHVASDATVFNDQWVHVAVRGAAGQGITLVVNGVRDRKADVDATPQGAALVGYQGDSGFEGDVFDAFFVAAALDERAIRARAFGWTDGPALFPSVPDGVDGSASPPFGATSAPARAVEPVSRPAESAQVAPVAPSGAAPKAQGALQIRDFIKTVSEQIEGARTQLKGRQGLTLGRVSIDFKVVPVGAGAEVCLPDVVDERGRPRERQVESASLSTMKFEFDPPPPPAAAEPPKATVPDVAGTTEVMARALLTEAGLTVEVHHQVVTDVRASGRVVRQYPNAGEALTRGTKVLIFLGKTS